MTILPEDANSDLVNKAGAKTVRGTKGQKMSPNAHCQYPPLEERKFLYL